MEPPAVPEEEMPLTAAPGPAGCQLFGYVGIEAVLDQMKIKTMKTGFEFNIMVVGEHWVRSSLRCHHTGRNQAFKGFKQQ